MPVGVGDVPVGVGGLPDNLAEHLLGLGIGAEEGRMDCGTPIGIADQDEIPRLHEPDRGRGMSCL